MAGLALFTFASLLCGRRVVAGLADRRPRAAGRRRGDHDPERALDRHDDVPRGPGAQQGARHLGLARRRRRHRGLADRRAADRPRLAPDLPDQRPRRRRRAGAGAAPAGARAASPTSRAATTPPARCSVTAGARAARLRGRRGAGERLGRRAHDRACSPAPPRCSALFAGDRGAASRRRCCRCAILRSRTLVGANALMLVFSGIGYGMPFVLTLYAQQVLGFSPLEFGLSSIVFPIGVTVGRDRRPGADRQGRPAAGRDRGPDAAGGELPLSRAGLGRRQLPGRHPDRPAARRARRRAGVRDVLDRRAGRRRRARGRARRRGSTTPRSRSAARSGPRSSRRSRSRSTDGPGAGRRSPRACRRRSSPASCSPASA